MNQGIRRALCTVLSALIILAVLTGMYWRGAGQFVPPEIEPGEKIILIDSISVFMPADAHRMTLHAGDTLEVVVAPKSEKARALALRDAMLVRGLTTAGDTVNAQILTGKYLEEREKYRRFTSKQERLKRIQNAFNEQ